jgi:zinc transport system substrate-binding protein
MKNFRACYISSQAIILIFLNLLINLPVFAKPKIVTSIVPLASIVAMLVKDKAEISSIMTINACPHHYHAQPSSIAQVREADIVIYINDQFDEFAAKLMTNHSKKIIQVSNFKSLIITSSHGHPNWHLWLGLSNVRILLEELSRELTKQLPEMGDYIYQNLAEAKAQIANLAMIKAEKLNGKLSLNSSVS